MRSHFLKTSNCEAAKPRDYGQSALAVPTAPEWLRSIQRDAEDRAVARLTMDEIDAEIDAARRERRAPGSQPGG